MKIYKLLTLAILFLASTALSFDRPVQTAAIEFGTEYFGIPASIGVAKTYNSGLVGSATYLIGRMDSTKYFDVYIGMTGNAWMEPTFGAIGGLSIMLTSMVLETTPMNNWSGSKFYIMPYASLCISNKEHWLSSFGVKLLVINK